MEKILEIAQLIVGRATPAMLQEDIEVYLDKIEVGILLQVLFMFFFPIKLY